MSDNKNIQDGRDKAKVSGSEDYEVSYMAEKHNVSPQQVRDAIKQVGNSRELLEDYLTKNKSSK